MEQVLVQDQVLDMKQDLGMEQDLAWRQANHSPRCRRGAGKVGNQE